MHYGFIHRDAAGDVGLDDGGRRGSGGRGGWDTRMAVGTLFATGLMEGWSLGMDVMKEGD